MMSFHLLKKKRKLPVSKPNFAFPACPVRSRSFLSVNATHCRAHCNSKGHSFCLLEGDITRISHCFCFCFLFNFGMTQMYHLKGVRHKCLKLFIVTLIIVSSDQLYIGPPYFFLNGSKTHRRSCPIKLSRAPRSLIVISLQVPGEAAATQQQPSGMCRHSVRPAWPTFAGKHCLEHQVDFYLWRCS